MQFLEKSITISIFQNKRLLEKIRRAITDNPESVVSPRANDRRGPVPVNPFTEYVNRLLFCDNVDLSQQVFCENSSSQYEIAETPMTRRRAQAQGETSFKKLFIRKLLYVLNP